MNAFNVPTQQYAAPAPENSEGTAGGAAGKAANDKQNNDVKNNEEFGSSSTQQNGSSSGYGRNNPNANHINNGNKRRTFNQNNFRVFNSNPKRTDVKFNSNVKNLHKNEQAINKMQQKNSNESVVSVVNTAATLVTSCMATKPVNGAPIYTQMPTNVTEQPSLQYGAGHPIELQQV